MSTPVDMVTAPTPPVKRWRGMRLALLASLAVNALFLGGLASALLRHDRNFGGGRGAGSQQNLGAYVTTLPTERRTSIFKIASEKRQSFNQQRRLVRQARDDAFAALSAEPFDKTKFVAAQTRLVDAEYTQRLLQRDMLHFLLHK